MTPQIIKSKVGNYNIVWPDGHTCQELQTTGGCCPTCFSSLGIIGGDIVIMPITDITIPED